MRTASRQAVLAAIAIVGTLALPVAAFADSGANGTAGHSPGAGSGDSPQVPVHTSVNQCGNTANVIGTLNPAFGNHCVD